MSIGRRCKAVLTRIQRPWVTVFTACCLMASVYIISQSRGTSSLVGLLTPRLHRFHQDQVDVEYVVAGPAGYRVVNTDLESMDDITRMLRETPERVFLVRWSGLQHREIGLYAPTERRTRAWCTVERADAMRVDSITERRIVDVFIPFLRSTYGGAYGSTAAALSASTRVDRTVPILAGYVHNSFAGLALVAFVFSLGWVPRSRATYIAWKRRRAAALGRCSKCGYSIAGLAAPVCPECGTLLARPDESAK